MSFTFEKTTRISLDCKLVPVQYREYENGLLKPYENISVNKESDCLLERSIILECKEVIARTMRDILLGRNNFA